MNSFQNERLKALVFVFGKIDMHILSTQHVNIYKKPVPIEHEFKITEATIGDLHANVIKLIYFLIRNGIIFMDDDIYNRLVELYKTPPDQWTQEYIDELADVVKSFLVINKEVLVRLLGDEVADRGPLDISILWFLAEYVKQGGLIQIHVSNHGFEFITYMESYLLRPASAQNPVKEFALFGLYDNKFTVSLANLHFIFHKGWVSIAHLRHLYETVYRPLLRVMTYSICPETGETHLFSHAESGLETLNALGEYFGFDCTQRTIKNITEAIDAYNHLFQKKYASVNRITIDGCYEMTEMNSPLSKISVMAHLVWRRTNNPEWITSPGQLEYGGSNPEESPRKIKWFHGHDKLVQKTGHSFTLDSDAGLPRGNPDDAVKYIDLVSDHLPQAMLIYKHTTQPQLKKLMINVSEKSKDDIAILWDMLWGLMFRFVVTVTHLQPSEKIVFEDEKESLLNEMLDLVPAQSRMDRLLLEGHLRDSLAVPLEDIFLRNLDNLTTAPAASSSGFFSDTSGQNNQRRDSQSSKGNNTCSSYKRKGCA